MYALLIILLHVAVSSPAAFVVAPYSIDPAANAGSLWALCGASAVLSMLGFAATAAYLSKRIRPITGVFAGVMCGLMCSSLLVLVARGTDFSLVLYLVLLAPTLLSVSLASMFDRSRTGWQ